MAGIARTWPLVGRDSQLALVRQALARRLAEHASALADGDPARLGEASAAFGALGYGLLAAETASEAAQLYDRQSKTELARAARARAIQLAAGCEGARTPALAGLSDLPITAREREVGELAARGLTNGQIAESLCVSVRTVENHLQRVFDKLGLSSRHALAPLLLDLAPGPAQSGSHVGRSHVRP